MAACSSSKTDGGSKSGSTIKVAVVPPSSGALAAFGTDALNGWEYAAAEANAKGGIDGHKVEIIKEDTDGTATATVRAVKNAVSQKGAKFLGGIITSTENAAVNQQLTSLGALSFNSLGQDDALTGKGCVPNGFHIVQNDSMNINAMAEVLKTLPGTKWAIMAEDYATGHNAADVFTKAVKAAGKTIVTSQFAPLGTTDFGSYITKIQNSGADSVFAVEFGADGVAYVNQAAQFKLSSTVKTTLGLNMVSEPLFPALKDKAVGIYNNVEYNVAGTGALNKSFVAGYTKKYGKAPYYVPADSYIAAETLFAGIKKAGSIDPAKVASALNDLTFDSVAGSVTMRGADHQLLSPTYVGQVVPAGSGQAFKIVATLPASKTSPTADPACKLK